MSFKYSKYQKGLGHSFFASFFLRDPGRRRFGLPCRLSRLSPKKFYPGRHTRVSMANLWQMYLGTLGPTFHPFTSLHPKMVRMDTFVLQHPGLPGDCVWICGCVDVWLKGMKK